MLKRQFNIHLKLLDCTAILRILRYPLSSKISLIIEESKCKQIWFVQKSASVKNGTHRLIRAQDEFYLDLDEWASLSDENKTLYETIKGVCENYTNKTGFKRLLVHTDLAETKDIVKMVIEKYKDA